jgi:excisionase family DNA binding protein
MPWSIAAWQAAARYIVGRCVPSASTVRVPASESPALEPLEALQRPTMTVREAAAVLGIDRGTAYDAVLPALRIGRKILVPTAPIRALLGMPPLEGEH